ncbi:MAG TPA: thioredoxin family protein [Streptosporangiaceae bacterium]|nr:thioredoxin family protein [Streptosporangiaceae bacterium]
MRAVSGVLAGVLACVLVLGAATAFGLIRRRRDGRLRAAGRARAGQRDDSGPRITAEQLGRPLGERATLLQFSSAFCAPCRATRVVLGDVAGRTDGVAHVELDAADRLDLVRLLDVRRTPTVFILDTEGRITRRGSGLVHREDVLSALGETG